MAETGSEITPTAAAAFTAATATTAARNSASASIAAARAAAATAVSGSTPRPSQAPQAAIGASWSSSSHSGGESLPEPWAEAPGRAHAAVTVEISFADDCDGIGMWSESGPLLALALAHGVIVPLCARVRGCSA